MNKLFKPYAHVLNFYMLKLKTKNIILTLKKKLLEMLRTLIIKVLNLIFMFLKVQVLFLNINSITFKNTFLLL